MADENKIGTILVLIAMEAEAAPFVQHLKLVKDEPSLIPGPLPALSFSGTMGNSKIIVVCNGKDAVHGVDSVGTVCAALTAYAAIQAVKPDLVINAGTAGGFKAMGGAVGDVYVGTAAKNHDRRIPIPGFESFGVGSVKSPSCPNLRAALPNLKAGVVTTGNSLDCTERDSECIKANEGSVKDMEAAALAHVAQVFGLPLLTVKSVTDIVDGDRATSEEFMENLASAAKSLQETLPQIIEFVVGKTLVEL
mmetsp:Transcript_30413/g.42090  ORF Transcript_30413/g.42090 Transcript_30413/m.42090 type:complete len:250 (-) Transcript_30413:99-848(-)|eukprot:CAMPEP_0196575120 /NCGR_PEP_ID=MMETSP1081-20130531/4673_1 /TAXON_ID=36882 /ORGANISM="Pyramimonas amylifera, Strain CCMP720" /LENGTH=249 /DNA_ID=CAMNT_0041893323 /DNA_START=144 /DNA_END=893 /DNA_ORIENTATION=-